MEFVGAPCSKNRSRDTNVSVLDLRVIELKFEGLTLDQNVPSFPSDLVHGKVRIEREEVDLGVLPFRGSDLKSTKGYRQVSLRLPKAVLELEDEKFAVRGAERKKEKKKHEPRFPQRP